MYAWFDVKSKWFNNRSDRGFYLQPYANGAIHSTCWSRSNDLLGYEPNTLPLRQSAGWNVTNHINISKFGMACPTNNKSWCLHFHLIHISPQHSFWSSKDFIFLHSFWVIREMLFRRAVQIIEDISYIVSSLMPSSNMDPLFSRLHHGKPLPGV